MNKIKDSKKVFYYLVFFGLLDIFYMIFKFVFGRYGIVDKKNVFSNFVRFKNIRDFFENDQFYNSGILLFFLIGLLLILLGVMFLKKVNYVGIASKILVTLFLFIYLFFLSGFFLSFKSEYNLHPILIIFTLVLLIIGLLIYIAILKIMKKKILQEEFTYKTKYLKYLFNVIVFLFLVLFVYLFYFGIKNANPTISSKNGWDIIEYFH